MQSLFFRGFLKKLSSNAPTESRRSSLRESLSSSAGRVKLKLPKLEIRKFSGESMSGMSLGCIL